MFFKPKRSSGEAMLQKHEKAKRVRLSSKEDEPRLAPEEVFRKLHSCYAKAVVFSVVNVCGSCTDEPSLQQINCQPSDLEPNLPMPLYKLYDDMNRCLSSAELSEVVLKTFSLLKVTQKEADFLEKSTQAQSSCVLWFNYRKGLITASHFHEVFRHKGNCYPKSIVATIMQYNPLNFAIPALKWGRENEDIARQDYVARMKGQHINFCVHNCGLVINVDFPYLGASPDGVVYCECCGKGLIEIKCPFKYKEYLPTCDTAISDPQYCLRKDNSGKISLSVNHKYYSQVQGQLNICNLEYCDFVCWTKRDIFVERIFKQKDYFTDMVPQLKLFFMNYLLPEILTHSHKPSQSNSVSANASVSALSQPMSSSTSMKELSKSKPSSNSINSSKSKRQSQVNSKSAKRQSQVNSKSKRRSQVNSKSKSTEFLAETSDSDELYCVCKSYKPDQMIACDNPQCLTEWYHFSCLGLKEAPKEDWYCPYCIDVHDTD